MDAVGVARGFYRSSGPESTKIFVRDGTGVHRGTEYNTHMVLDSFCATLSVELQQKFTFNIVLDS